jgi:hypothetical protein
MAGTPMQDLGISLIIAAVIVAGVRFTYRIEGAHVGKIETSRVVWLAK